MSSNAKKYEVVYTTLDVLLDTRLGTLARMGEEIAERVLESGYHTRVSDDFPGVDKDQYQTLYKNRDVETLKYSVVSNAMPFLRDLVGLLAEQAITRPYHHGGKIVLNLFPYELTSEEQELLHKCVKQWLNDAAPIELVFISPEKLTPTLCKQEYSAMMVYEYEDWLNMHTPELANVRLPSVDMYAPALYCKVPTTEELAQVTREAMHPFRAIEMHALPIIGLKLIDVQHFCVLDPRYSIVKKVDSAQSGQNPA